LAACGSSALTKTAGAHDAAHREPERPGADNLTPLRLSTRTGSHPPFLQIGYRLLKNRAVGVTVFQSFAVLLQEITIEITEECVAAGRARTCGC
jgi:hypothetical protein